LSSFPYLLLLLLKTRLKPFSFPNVNFVSLLRLAKWGVISKRRRAAAALWGFQITWGSSSPSSGGVWDDI
jgi:hypothetical protein